MLRSLSLRGSEVFFKKARKLTFKMEKELQRLQNLDGIEQVDFSNRTAPIVAVRKAQRDAGGESAICADYSMRLNAML